MTSKQPSSLFFITLAFLLTILCNTALAQDWLIIDDRDPALVYYGDWKQGPCSDCYSPDMQLVTGQTWHMTRTTSSSGRSGFSVQFEGNQVVLGILTNDQEPDVKTNITVVLDGKGFNYAHYSENTGSISTNVVAFFSHEIEYGVHSFSVEVEPDSLFLFDYVAFDTGRLTSTAGSSGSASGSQGPSSSTSTSGSVAPTGSNSGGSSGTKTSSGSSGTSLSNTFVRATTSIDPATLTVLNVQAFTVPYITTTDSEGRTYYPPQFTTIPFGSDPSNVGSGNSNGNGPDSSNTPFSPALAGAIGAAVAALAAVLVVVVMFCMRRRRRLASQARPSSAEPYILAGSSTNTTPSSQNTNLSLSAEPVPYPGSALGLYNPLPAGVAGIGANGRPAIHDLLSSPPPNTLASPISPNIPYPYSSINTPITPNPNHAYLHTGVMPSPLSPLGYGGLTSGYPPEKPSRHASVVHQNPQIRSSVRPMHPRPRDWEIEEESIIQNMQPTPLPIPQVTTTDTTTNLTNTTTTQTPTSAMPPNTNITPTSALPSPAFTGPFPSPHPSTRRSRSRPKEYLDLPAELQIPPPPLQNSFPLPTFTVPILREPTAGMRRGRRRNTESAAQAQHAPMQGQGGLTVPLQEAVMTEHGLEYGRTYDPYSGAYNGGGVMYRHGHERTISEDNDARLQGYHPSQHHHEAYHGMMQNIHNLAPVVRRVSLTHPAPPAYSPPRLIRNADPERDML